MKRLLFAAFLAALPACALAQSVPPHANTTSPGDQVPLFQVTNGGVIQQRSVTLDQLPPKAAMPFLTGAQKTNQWYGPAATPSTGTPTAGRLYAIPLYVGSAAAIVNLAANVTATTGGALRLGVYADNGSGAPGNLLYDSGVLNVSATGPQQTGAISVATNGPAWVWLASVWSATSTPTVTAVLINGTGVMTQVLFGAGSAANLFAGTYNTGVYSGSYSDSTVATALPATFGSATLNGAMTPSVGARF